MSNSHTFTPNKTVSIGAATKKVDLDEVAANTDHLKEALDTIMSAAAADGALVAASLTTTGNVGIGRASPATPLEVVGTGNITGQFDSSGTYAGLALNATGTSSNGQVVVRATGDDLELVSGGLIAMTLDDSQNVGIGTISPNALATLDQGASDNTIFDCASSDVGHGRTSLLANTSYFGIEKTAGAYGGTTLRGIADDDASAAVSFRVHASGATAGTGKTAANAIGLVDILVDESTGNAAANITADGNVFSVRAYVGGSYATRFMVDEDGDVYSVVSTAMQTFDGYDDVALLSAFDSTVAPDEVCCSMSCRICS